MTQEARYWGNMPYNEFASQWNNLSIHPSSSGNNLQSTGLAMMIQGATLAMADSPLPGLADIPGWLWALGGICLAGLSVLAYPNGAIAIPQRQPYDFAQERADATAVPIPLDRVIPATPTQGRASMRVQLQGQQGGTTTHYTSTPIYDLTGNGVTTVQVIQELQLLRQNPNITRREQSQATQALQDAITFTLSFRPYGWSQQGNHSSYFNRQQKNNTKRFDIENLVGTNLRT
jgi:hypothetical protein